MKSLALNEYKKITGTSCDYASYSKIHSRYLSTVNNMRSSGRTRREILNELEQLRTEMYSRVGSFLFVYDASCVSFKAISNLIYAIENDQLHF